MRIVADENIPCIRGKLEPYAAVDYLPSGRFHPEVVRTASAVIVRSHTRCGSDLLEGSDVKLIATATAGDDHIDKSYCRQRNIRWIAAPGSNAPAVAQYVLSVLLHLSIGKKMLLKGKTLGIVGVGHIGGMVARVASLLGMEVLLNDPPRALAEGSEAFVSLEELLLKSDIITLHVPLSTEGDHSTFHLADSLFFEKMRAPVMLINTSRGEVVCRKSLIHALQSGKITAAAMDVWEKEPEIDRELPAFCEIATPHIAGYSIQGKMRASEMVLKGVCDHFGFRPANLQCETAIPPATYAMDAAGKSPEQVLCEAVAEATGLVTESAKLKASPADFLRLRAEYGFRQENGNIVLEINNHTPAVIGMLEKFGFIIKLK